ncbi:MAG TPA: hypothetical protein VI758_04380 [Bacteroidota bacterium]
MRSPEDLEKHQSLIDELVEVFQRQGFSVSEAEGRDEFQPPRELFNDGYGDQLDKAPDVYAYDPRNKYYVLGEAKTGANDLETDHALTQYNVFLDQESSRTGRKMKLYIIVPAMKVPEFNTLITHYIHREYWQNIVVVSSARWSD